MDLTRDIQTVSEFKQNASKLIKQVQETRQPVVLTVNGKPAAVVQDVETYQQMATDAEYSTTVRELREAIEYVDKGGTLISAEDVFAKISKKHGVSFEDING